MRDLENISIVQNNKIYSEALKSLSKKEKNFSAVAHLSDELRFFSQTFVSPLSNLLRFRELTFCLTYHLLIG